jgi:hypothetical protein
MLIVPTYLEKLLQCLRLSMIVLEVPAGILNHFWIQAAVSFLEPPHGGFRSETAVAQPFQEVNRLQIYNGCI